MKFILNILIILSLISCQNEKQESNNKAIARVSTTFLYLSEIEDLVPPGTSKKDSAIIVKDFMDRWASQKLLYKAADQNLPKEKLDELNALVEQYKKDLFTEAYLEQLVLKSIDTSFSETVLESYYTKNKEKFKANDELVKLKYIQINKKNPKINKLASRFVNFSKENKKVLLANAVEFKSYAFNDSVWVDMEQVYEKLPFITSENKSTYLVVGKTYKYQDEKDVYYIKTSDKIEKNQILPFQYVKPTLKKIMLNQRKMELLQSYKKEIITDAIKDDTYEIFPRK